MVKFLVLAGAALALFAASASAQSRSGKVFTRVQKPLTSATLDLATGTVIRAPVASNRAAGTVVDFFNGDLGGFVGVDTGGGFCEWFDAGVKGSKRGDGTSDLSPADASGHVSDLMNSIVFAYCSSALSAGSGGVGGSVKLGFYEGYVTGGGVATTGVASFTLTGLPANTSSSDFFHGFSCYFIRIFFGDLVCFADGPIGYSWRFLDNGTGFVNPQGAILAATFPFLACVKSCSAQVGGLPDGQGMDDLIDQYCPPGTLRSTFSFGTPSGSFTSISMIIEEVAVAAATVTFENSTTFPNPDVLTGDPAVVGQPWSASLTLGRQRSKAGKWNVFFGSSKIAPPSGVAIAMVQGGLNFGTGKAGRMLLCALNTSGFSCAGTHTGVSGSVSSTNCGGGTIPKALALVCNEWCAQAVVIGTLSAPENGNARLSSVINGVVGSTF